MLKINKQYFEMCFKNVQLILTPYITYHLERLYVVFDEYQNKKSNYKILKIDTQDLDLRFMKDCNCVLDNESDVFAYYTYSIIPPNKIEII